MWKRRTILHPHQKEWRGAQDSEWNFLSLQMFSSLFAVASLVEWNISGSHYALVKDTHICVYADGNLTRLIEPQTKVLCIKFVKVVVLLLCLFVSVCLSVYQSVCLCMYLSASLSVYLPT